MLEFVVVILLLAASVYFTFMRPKQVEEATNAAREEWDAQQGKYEAIVRKLPPDLANQLFELLKQACNTIKRVVPDTFPEELTKMLLATGTVVQNGSFGAVTMAQHRQISNILDENLNWVVNMYIPAANQTLMQLADSDGLGFGLITSSAADAMLYSAMDTHQKLKGNEKRIKEYEESIDKQLTPIFEKIRQIVS